MLNAQWITDHWSLTDVTFGESMQTYPTRQVIPLHAKEGAFVAKIDSYPPSLEIALQGYAVFDFLTSRKFSHIPALLKTRDGQRLHYTKHQSVAVMEHIDGRHPEPTAATWQELGRIAATLNAFTDYPFPYAIPMQGVIGELTEQAQSHPHKAQFLEFISLLSPLIKYPKQGLIHAEINLANSARRQNGEMVLLDWDDVGTGPTILEVGYPLLVVFLSEELHFHQEQAQAFYHGYYGETGPSATEKELLFRAALLHALRYMQFANQEKRWLRICHAVAHKESLLAAIW